MSAEQQQPQAEETPNWTPEHQVKVAKATQLLIEITSGLLSELQVKMAHVQDLEKKLQDIEAEKINLVKVASAQVLDESQLGEMIDKLVSANLVREGAKVSMTTAIQSDPNQIFPFVGTVLNRFSGMLAPDADGSGQPKQANTQQTEDQDGWDAFANGEEVAVKAE